MLRVKFNDKDDVYIVPRKGADEKMSRHGALRTSGLCDKELAQRSLLRADDNCSCFKCQCENHSHEAIFTNCLKKKIHCGNSSRHPCYCAKNICRVCLELNLHTCMKCQSLLHTDKFHCGVKICLDGKMRCTNCRDLVKINLCESSLHQSETHLNVITDTDNKKRCIECRLIRQNAIDKKKCQSSLHKGDSHDAVMTDKDGTRRCIDCRIIRYRANKIRS